jgi:hypothetical protein
MKSRIALVTVTAGVILGVSLEPASAQSCGELGGNYCSQSGACPSGSTNLGQSFYPPTQLECNPCCACSFSQVVLDVTEWGFVGWYGSGFQDCYFHQVRRYCVKNPCTGEVQCPECWNGQTLLCSGTFNPANCPDFCDSLFVWESCP